MFVDCFYWGLGGLLKHERALCWVGMSFSGDWHSWFWFSRMKLFWSNRRFLWSVEFYNLIIALITDRSVLIWKMPLEFKWLLWRKNGWPSKMPFQQWLWEIAPSLGLKRLGSDFLDLGEFRQSYRASKEVDRTADLCLSLERECLRRVLPCSRWAREGLCGKDTMLYFNFNNKSWLTI